VLDVVHFASPGYGPAWPVPAPPGPTITLPLAPDNGPTSGLVAVFFNGSGFTGKFPQVEFGGTMIQSGIVVVSDTQFRTSTVPAHAAGPVDVRVWFGTPTPTVLPAAFTYV
jgi:hypothetical protein